MCVYIYIYYIYIYIYTHTHTQIIYFVATVSSWLRGRCLDWRLSQPGFDPSYEKLVCLATLMNSDRMKQICQWITHTHNTHTHIYIYIYIYIYIIYIYIYIYINSGVKKKYLLELYSPYNW